MKNFTKEIARIQNEIARSNKSASFKKYKMLFLCCLLAWIVSAALLFLFFKFWPSVILPMISLTVYLYATAKRELHKKEDTLFDNLSDYFESLARPQDAKKKLIKKMLAHYQSELDAQDAGFGIGQQGKIMMVFLSPAIPFLYKIIKMPMSANDSQSYLYNLVAVYLLGTLTVTSAYFLGLVLGDLLDYKRRSIKEIMDTLAVISWNCGCHEKDDVIRE